MSHRIAPTAVRFRWIVLLFLVSLAARVEATISVTLSANPSSPQPLATTITWTATVTDSAGGAHEYQFSVDPPGADLQPSYVTTVPPRRFHGRRARGKEHSPSA